MNSLGHIMDTHRRSNSPSRAVSSSSVLTMSDPQPRIRVINPNSNETVTRGERRSARKRCASIDAIVRLPQPDTPITTTTEGSSIRQRRSCSGPKARSLVEPISPGAVKLVFVQPEVAWYRSCRRYWTRKTCVTQIEWRLKKNQRGVSADAPQSGVAKRGRVEAIGDIFSQPSSGFRTIQGRVQRPAAHPDACLTKV
jgi:hypothetical protein